MEGWSEDHREEDSVTLSPVHFEAGSNATPEEGKQQCQHLHTIQCVFLRRALNTLEPPGSQWLCVTNSPVDAGLHPDKRHKCLGMETQGGGRRVREGEYGGDKVQ